MTPSARVIINQSGTVPSERIIILQKGQIPIARVLPNCNPGRSVNALFDPDLVAQDCGPQQEVPVELKPIQLICGCVLLIIYYQLWTHWDWMQIYDAHLSWSAKDIASVVSSTNVNRRSRSKAATS